MHSKLTIQQLGWNSYFSQQLTLDDYQHRLIARVVEQQRSGYRLLSEQGAIELANHHQLPAMAVGDWLLLNQQLHFVRLLERRSLFQRKAAGSKLARQLIAANVDTLFIVSSLNHDLKLSRIERYLALAYEVGAQPVVVLTKADLCIDASERRAQVQGLDPMLLVETVNALDSDSIAPLTHWCGSGQTVAVMGSSGVGKSTLSNTLLGEGQQQTGGIREDDSKGRHVTTARSLHRLPHGGVLIDTPGMRELQLSDCEAGVKETFSDIEELAQQCRFSDCQHGNEPGCAVQQALGTGEIDQRRLDNYFKLLREQARNGASLAQQRSKDREFAKMCRSVMSEKRRRKSREG